MSFDNNDQSSELRGSGDSDERKLNGENGEIEQSSDSSQDTEGSRRGETGDESAEEKAKILGWTPKDRFKGDPDRWIDAKTFLEKSEKSMPLLKSDNEKLFREIQAAKESAKEAREYYLEAIKRTEKAAYEKARKELLKEQKAAVLIGDDKTWEELEEQKSKLDSDHRKQIEEIDTPKQKPEDKKAEQDYEYFLQKNKWYEADPELQELADDVSYLLRQKGETSSGLAFMNKVAEKVRRMRPDKFTNPNREKVIVTEESRSSSSNKSAKTFNNLPESAKKTCDDMIKRGFFKTRDEYLANYDW